MGPSAKQITFGPLPLHDVSNVSKGDDIRCVDVEETQVLIESVGNIVTYRMMVYGGHEVFLLWGEIMSETWIH